jgi:hypothetical protein
VAGQARNNLFDDIVSLFLKNGDRYNLLNSALLDLFEYIRRENLKLLMEHVVRQVCSPRVLTFVSCNVFALEVVNVWLEVDLLNFVTAILYASRGLHLACFTVLCCPWGASNVLWA